MSNVATTQNENTVKIEKKEPARIKVEEHMTFDANIKSCYINTIELAAVVDSLFCPAFRDYVGCKIHLNNGDVPAHIASEIPMGKLYVSIYFKDRSNTNSNCPINNVTLRLATKGETKFASLMKMSGSNAGRMYDISEETYQALDEYRFFPGHGKWNYLTTEVVTNFGFSGNYNQEIAACITGLDLEKIINAIYGTRTDEGIFQYQANPVQFVANVNGEYLVQITQLDMRKLQDLRKQLGGRVTVTEYHECVR